MSSESKLISIDIAERLCRESRRVVFTNGVFDILHRGHVTYLEAAREFGDALIVAVNSDASARALGKGPERPLNRERDRAFVIAALQCTSHVVVFDEPTPCAVLRRLKPQVYVKGGDYDIESLEETKLVRGWGGRAVSIPFVEGYSTTALVRRISTSAIGR